MNETTVGMARKLDGHPGSEIVQSTLPDYVKMGRHTYAANIGFVRWGNETVEIGQFCSIGQLARFVCGGNHRTDTVSTFPFDTILMGKARTAVEDRSYSSKNLGITVGNDVWIGYGAVIYGGVEIEDGAVIAAGAHVFQSVPAYGIATGNPAKTNKFRFDLGMCQKLLEIAWWDWSDDQLRERVDDFYLPVKEFIVKYHHDHGKADEAFINRWGGVR